MPISWGGFGGQWGGSPMAVPDRSCLGIAVQMFAQTIDGMPLKPLKTTENETPVMFSHSNH